MPRTLLTAGNEYKKELPGTIKAKMAYMGIDSGTVASVAGISARTLSNRYKEPDLFTLEQLYRICKKLKFEIVINDTGVHCRMEREK